MRLCNYFLIVLFFSPFIVAEDFVEGSLFSSTLQFSDQNGEPFLLSQQRGHVQVVAFVYTGCRSVCPIIIADLMRLDAMLPAALRASVHYLLVSLDAKNDSAASMKQFLQEHNMASSRWRFVRGSGDATREMAMLFDVRYREDAQEIAHSNLITVLDTQGLISYQRKGSESLAAAVAAISADLANQQ